jgi:hypothetical protein
MLRFALSSIRYQLESKQTIPRDQEIFLSEAFEALKRCSSLGDFAMDSAEDIKVDKAPDLRTSGILCAEARKRMSQILNVVPIIRDFQEKTVHGAEELIQRYCLKEEQEQTNESEGESYLVPYLRLSYAVEEKDAVESLRTQWTNIVAAVSGVKGAKCIKLTPPIVETNTSGASDPLEKRTGVQRSERGRPVLGQLLQILRKHERVSAQVSHLFVEKIYLV